MAETTEIPQTAGGKKSRREWLAQQKEPEKRLAEIWEPRGQEAWEQIPVEEQKTLLSEFLAPPREGSSLTAESEKTRGVFNLTNLLDLLDEKGPDFICKALVKELARYPGLSYQTGKLIKNVDSLNYFTSIVQVAAAKKAAQ